MNENERKRIYAHRFKHFDTYMQFGQCEMQSIYIDACSPVRNLKNRENCQKINKYMNLIPLIIARSSRVAI